MNPDMGDYTRPINLESPQQEIIDDSDYCSTIVLSSDESDEKDQGCMVEYLV